MYNCSSHSVVYAGIWIYIHCMFSPLDKLLRFKKIKKNISNYNVTGPTEESCHLDRGGNEGNAETSETDP